MRSTARRSGRLCRLACLSSGCVRKFPFAYDCVLTSATIAQLFLTDLIFVFEGNRAERPSPVDPSLQLINFDRYHVRLRRSSSSLLKC